MQIKKLIYRVLFPIDIASPVAVGWLIELAHAIGVQSVGHVKPFTTRQITHATRVLCIARPCAASMHTPKRLDTDVLDARAIALR